MPTAMSASWILVAALWGCGRDHAPEDERVEVLCDAVDVALIEYSGHLGAARNEARLAAEPTRSESERGALCATMAGSLRATSAYLAGYRKGVTALPSVGLEIVPVGSESLQLNMTEAEVHCREGQSAPTTELLARFEREIEEDFARQFALCRALGWVPIEER